MKLKNFIPLKKEMDLPITAASGLVKRGEQFYVIADDELSLFIFRINEPQKHEALPLFPGSLPQDFKARKALKPDWESLCLLPKTQHEPEALVVIPSGSKKNRCLGSYLEFSGSTTSTPLKIDFFPIYEKLEETFKDLNIEGAVVQGNSFKLFQRGNGESHQNAVIDLDLLQMRELIRNRKSLEAKLILKITHFNLGSLNKVAMGFTDACSLTNNQLFFLSVAENSQSTYEDGEYQGASLGCLNSDGKIQFQTEIQCDYKPEGLWVEEIADNLKFFLVTDADDPSKRAALYSGIIPNQLRRP